MKRLLPALLLALQVICFADTLHAQVTHPKLAPIKARYDADAKAVRIAREQAQARAVEKYTAALANAEKSAAASRDLKSVAAVGRERQAVSDGKMAPAFPSELPASLQNARREYLAGLAKAAGEFAPRLQKLDQEYIAQLARIDTGTDAALAAEVTAEKQRVLESAGEQSAAAADSLIGKHSVVNNGDFSIGEPGSVPKGWEPAYPNGGAKLVSDGANAVVRLERIGSAENVGVKQEVPVPAGARTASFRARMRGKPKNLKEQPRAAAQITLRIRDAKGEMLTPAILTSKHSAQWQNELRTLELPAGAKSVEVVVRSVFAEGTFDFDDVSLEFR